MNQRDSEASSCVRHTCRSVLAGALLAVTACSGAGAETHEPAAQRQPWTTTRAPSGDTIVVRHTGISDAAAELTLVEEQRITGADVPGSPGFSRIYSTTPAADDGVLVYEQGARALIEFDPAGRYRRAIGRFGQGPGEHTSFHSLIIGPDGRYYFGEISGGHIFSPTGEYERSWPRLNREVSASLRHVTADGRLSFHTLVRPPWNPDSIAPGGQRAYIPAAVRLHLDSAASDTSLAPAPLAPEEHLPITSQNEGVTWPLRIPLYPYQVNAFGSGDYWIRGDASRYSLTLLRQDAPVRIERDYSPVTVTPQERQSLLDIAVYRYRATGWQMDAPLSVVPRTKPAFHRISTDADGRILVWVHTAGIRHSVDTTRMLDSLLRGMFTVVDGKRVPRAGAAIAPDRPPVPAQRWVEPARIEFFRDNGDYLGRLSLRDDQRWGNARGDRIWLIEEDADGVPALVRYRVTGPVRWTD